VILYQKQVTAFTILVNLDSHQLGCNLFTLIWGILRKKNIPANYGEGIEPEHSERFWREPVSEVAKVKWAIKKERKEGRREGGKKAGRKEKVKIHRFFCSPGQVSVL
jgi:hypothetical protein